MPKTARQSDVTATAEPFGVYVHWPFCAAKCPYCDFNSHVRYGGIDEDRFLAAYLKELAYFAERTPGREVTSVFFGGGTPSLMSPHITSAILEAISKHWKLCESAEITLEANPTSAEAENFRGYASAGVNRMSLGVQALDDQSLNALGRLHTANEALAAFALARETFERTSFDLIYAREGQSLDDWREELSRALSLAADHLSLYQLTIEAGTPFAALHESGRLRVPEGDTARAMYVATQELCEAAGLLAYEISNHATPSAESRHNLVYWRGHDYVGVGAGAHARITTDGTRRGLSTLRLPEEWLAQVEARGHGLVSDEALTKRETAEEYLLMALRLSEGIDASRFEALGGEPLDETRIGTLVEDGLLLRNGKRLMATPQGRLVLERMIVELAV
jgi:oxygen-independent coproporphyrinogen-3 oxidase